MPQASILQTFAQEDLTVDATTGGVRLTLSNILTTPPALAATLIVETAQIRWKKDAAGTVTSTTGGLVANVGAVLFLDNANDMTNWRGIRTGSTSGKVHVEYHR